MNAEARRRAQTSMDILGHPFADAEKRPVQKGEHYVVLAYTDYADVFAHPDGRPPVRAGVRPTVHARCSDRDSFVANYLLLAVGIAAIGSGFWLGERVAALLR